MTPAPVQQPLNPGRIVMLTNAISPDKLGGLERYVRELAVALVRTGVPVTVLTKQVEAGHPIKEVTEDGVEIVRHRTPARNNPAYVFLYPVYVGAAVARELRQYPDAVVHGHYAVTTLPVALSGRRYINTFHSPVYKEVLLEHAGRYWLPAFAERSVVAAVRSVERRVVTSAYRNVTLSNFMRDEVGQLANLAGMNTMVIPGGVDADFFCEGTPGRDEWSRTASPLLFTARRLVTRTGVEELVNAMALLRDITPEARLAIAGDGPRRVAIEEAIRAHGLSDRVRLLGRVSEDELRGWYRAAHLTVIPTQQLEGFGLTTAESLCCGTPALVTPIGGSPELVSDMHPLFVTDDCTAAGIANAVRRLLEAPDVLRTARAEARHYAVERWSWDVVARRYREAYADLMRGRSASSSRPEPQKAK